MVEFSKPKIEYKEISKNRGRFIIEPLERGFGTTLGNALRRVLLSSLPGAAVTAVRIDGIQHEFSTIPYVKEDTIEFLLNVKGIRLRRLTNRPGKLTLEVSGEREVRAGDITPSADFEIVNPEHHLATLDSPEAKLSVEFEVEIGKGYVLADSSQGRPIGVLPLDAIFTPVREANFRVEKTRVGGRSDYDRLILEVCTDGTISPEEAVKESAQILTQHLSLFYQAAQPPEVVEAPGKPTLPAEQREMPLEQLGLSPRTLNTLRREGINSVGELLEKTKDELLELKNFGQKSWEEVKSKLESLGLAEFSAALAEGEVTEEKKLEEMKKKLQEKFKVREEK